MDGVVNKLDLARLATKWEAYSSEYQITADDMRYPEGERALAQRSQDTWLEAAGDIRKLLG